MSDGLMPKTESSIQLPDNNNDQGGSWFDRWVEQGTRSMSKRVSRRSALTAMGKFLLALVGAELLTILPLDRQVEVAKASGVESGHNCSYWAYCGINAPRLCYCCVNNHCMCPYGTLPGGAWQACCNTGTGSRYWVTYWDCCASGPPIQCINPNCSCQITNNPAYCSGYYCTAICIGSAC